MAILVLVLFANTGHILYTKETFQEPQRGDFSPSVRHAPIVSELSQAKKKAHVVHDNLNQTLQKDQEVGVEDKVKQHATAKEMGGNCQPLHFIHEHPMPRTALDSFPGSGNTWVRHLLQQATGRILIPSMPCREDLKIFVI